jgi:hypothetical protein
MLVQKPCAFTSGPLEVVVLDSLGHSNTSTVNQLWDYLASHAKMKYRVVIGVEPVNRVETQYVSAFSTLKHHFRLGLLSCALRTYLDKVIVSTVACLCWNSHVLSQRILKEIWDNSM